jgi:predicted AAA+ superfamily ATPase
MELHSRRTAIAEELARAALGESILATSSLFLGAPRRTGKSTFLQEDLIPALENNGALVLYVDLWSCMAA